MYDSVLMDGLVCVCVVCVCVCECVVSVYKCK